MTTETTERPTIMAIIVVLTFLVSLLVIVIALGFYLYFSATGIYTSHPAGCAAMTAITAGLVSIVSGISISALAD